MADAWRAAPPVLFTSGITKRGAYWRTRLKERGNLPKYMLMKGIPRDDPLFSEFPDLETTKVLASYPLMYELNLNLLGMLPCVRLCTSCFI